MLKLCVTGVVLGGSMLVAQTVPQVPEDFKDWPVTAIAGLLALVCIMGMLWQTNKMYKQQAIDAENRGAMLEAQREANRGLSEVAKKLGDTNEGINNLTTEFRTRPCMAKDRLQ